MFLPHTIAITTRSITINNWETRYTPTVTITVDAMVYKKSKNTMIDAQSSRDQGWDEYNVIIDMWPEVLEWDIVVPNLWKWDIGEFVVLTIDENYAYTPTLENTFFTIRKR